MTQSKLEELSAEATQGKWNRLTLACDQGSQEQAEANLDFAAALVNAYRSGELVPRSASLIPKDRP